MAAVFGATLFLLRAGGSGPSTTVIAALAVIVAAAGVAGGAIGAVRRFSTRALVVAALALAALLGLGTALLVLGRTPDGDERVLIAPVVAGVVLCGLVAGPLTRWGAELAHAWARGTERALGELLNSLAIAPRPAPRCLSCCAS